MTVGGSWTSPTSDWAIGRTTHHIPCDHGPVIQSRELIVQPRSTLPPACFGPLAFFVAQRVVTRLPIDLPYKSAWQIGLSLRGFAPRRLIVVLDA
jgi:hypothetical protein